MSKFLVFVLSIIGAAYPLSAQPIGKAPEINLAPGPTIVIDGKIEDAEWKGASSFPVKNGGTVFFGYDGNYLFVGVRGSGYGWSHLYLNYADVPEVYVHHASAALGMIAYRSGKDGKWQSSNPFSWDLRDRVINPEVQKKMDDYLAKNFWVANNNNTGNRNEIEFKIKPRSDKPFRIGVVFAVGETGRYFFPETLSDATLKDELSGETPRPILNSSRAMGNRYPGEKEDKMKQILILTLLIISAGATGLAQGGAKTNDDAAAVPDLLFTAMRAKNADDIRAVLSPRGSWWRSTSPGTVGPLQNPRFYRRCLCQKDSGRPPVSI